MWEVRRDDVGASPTPVTRDLRKWLEVRSPIGVEDPSHKSSHS